MTEPTDLGMADDRKRGKKDEVFSLNNLVVFPFTEMGKLWRKQACGENEKFHLNPTKFEIRRSSRQLRE